MTFNFDPTGKFVIEVREDGEVATIVGRDDNGIVRVRVFEPGFGDAEVSAAKTGPRYKHAFVVLVALASPRHPRLPIQTPSFAARCYGRTLVEAAQLYTAVSHAIHAIGPRVHGNGLGIYTSHDTSGGTPEKDPDTGQPYYTFIFEAVATTQAVGA